MVNDASDFYKHISKEVSVPATDVSDLIRVVTVDNNRIEVTVDRHTNSGTHRHYSRTVEDDVTNELRLFGLNKDDTFRISGTGNPDIRIRLVGGTGEDVVINDSRSLDIIAYDGVDGMSFSGEKMTEHLNDKPFNNTYDRTDWKLNKSFHFPSPAYFTDEGFGLSYNVWWTRHGFRSDPYRSNHVLGVSYFFNTGAFVGRYKGDWPRALGDIDFQINIFATGPTSTQYYYGLGNRYVDFGEKSTYHIVKGTQINLAPSLGKRFGFGSRIYLSPSYQYLDLEDSHSDLRFVYTPASGLSPEDFGLRQYAGVSLGYNFQRLDNIGFPTRGGDVDIRVGGQTSLKTTDISHGLISGSGTLYIPFNVTGSIVLATHIQADKILGDYEFFHALTLGGPDKLRGFKQDRFAGDARFYQATDLRFKLFQTRGAVAFGVGVYGGPSIMAGFGLRVTMR